MPSTISGAWHSLGTLQARLGLDTATFGQKFGSFTNDLEKRAKGLSRGLSGLTNFGSLVGGAGIGAALSQGINVALEMGKTSVFPANQAAAAMLDLAKAGLTPAQIGAGALASTIQLAATEGMELSRAAEVMAEEMGAFGLKAADTAGIADALAGASIASTASTASVDGLAQGLSQVAAVANLSGLSLQDTVWVNALTSFVQWVTANLPTVVGAFTIGFSTIVTAVTTATEAFDAFIDFLQGMHTPARRAHFTRRLFGPFD